MVRRLADQPHLPPRITRQRQPQARLPAAGARRDRTQRAVAIEAEAAEEGARDLFAEARVETLEVIDRRCRRVELLELVLGEVADRKIARGDALAGERRRRARQQLDQRGFSRAVRAEQGDAVAWRETELDAVEHAALAVARGDLVETQQRHRQRGRFAEFEADR